MVAHEVEQCNGFEAERFGAGPHRIEADLGDEGIGGEIVAEGSDERCEIRHRKGGRLEVSPNSGVGHILRRRLVDDAETRGVLRRYPRRHFDEQKDLAHARRRQHDALVDRHQHGSRPQVDRVRADLRPGVGEGCEGCESGIKCAGLGRAAMTSRAGRADAFAPQFGRIHQIVTRSDGASQRASDSVTPNVS